MGGEEEKIFVVTGSGKGHLSPCLELCNHLALRNYHTTLVIPSTLDSSIPSSFARNPLTSALAITGPLGPPSLGPGRGAQDLEAHLEAAMGSARRPLCAVVDFQMGWAKTVFWKFGVPVAALFTFGACAAAMEWGTWKARVGDIGPGEPMAAISGLPEEMALEDSDRKRRPAGPNRMGGPPKPGDRPPWVPEIEGSIGLMFNTCDDLERPFIDYVIDQMEMPAWAVGPLLPEQYWKPSDSLIRDRHVREQNHQSNYNEDEVIQWLDCKPRGSVLYVAFGSEVSPTTQEQTHLARALEESNRPYIWVIRDGERSGDKEEEHLDEKAGQMGLIMCGWAPQLLILSHPSTGGFLSHCGWNSTAEALGRGVPLLAWPIRGDQHYNAKLVASYLKVGYMVSEDFSETVKKEDIAEGIEKLMGDQEMKMRAMALRRKFEHGFPASSARALDAFVDFIRRKRDRRDMNVGV